MHKHGLAGVGVARELLAERRDHDVLSGKMCRYWPSVPILTALGYELPFGNDRFAPRS